MQTRARVAAFVRLSRLRFLIGGFLGVGLGTAVAAFERGSVDWGLWALAQVTVTAFQLMTHYANDFFDREGDARASRTPFSGGSGMLVDGSLPARAGLVAALVCLVVGLFAATLFWALGLRSAALLAGTIALLAWAYSAPPVRLLAAGAGELDAALVVGILVPLLGYAAQANAFDLRMLATALPGAAALFAMMLGVEAPDEAADAASGKRNLLVRFGRRTLPSLGWTAIVAVYAAIAAGLAAGAPPAWGILGALTFVPAAGLVRAFGASARAGARRDAALAARGVAFFVLVELYGLLGYVAALRWQT